MRLSAGISRSSKKISVVEWLIMVRIGRISSPLPFASRMSTRKTDSPSVRFFTSAAGVVRASRSIRSECSARDVQTFCPLTT